jgi:hypothetical protein
MSIESAGDLAGMQRVGRVVALTIEEMRAAVRIGMTTAELDAVAASTFKRHGARSAPQLAYGFPGTTCISVNDEIVHGVPGPRRLQPGDVLKIDVTAELAGYVADAATTILLPPFWPKVRSSKTPPSPRSVLRCPLPEAVSECPSSAALLKQKLEERDLASSASCAGTAAAGFTSRRKCRTTRTASATIS